MSAQMIEDIVTLVKPDDTLLQTAQKIAEKRVVCFGLAVVVDSNRRVLGVINDGDFLRLLAKNMDMSQSVESAMEKNPIRVNDNLSHEEIIEDVRKQLRERNDSDKDSVRYVLVVNKDDVIVNAYRFVDLLSYYKRFGEKVAVYGQGFVGLTVSAALANRGHNVTGIDTDQNLIDNLNSGVVHIYEPRLADTVKASIERKALKFEDLNGDYDANVYIIAVGSPVDENGNADLSAIKEVCKNIAGKLKRGDLVMLRSTIPAGATRQIVKPLLEEHTGFKAGHDFYLAFTPERTVEGKAMTELKSLPQIVGGLTHICTQKASTFWGTLTDSVIHVQSLEAAELIKLINNSFRDLSFSFSNAFALLCDKYNLDAFQVIDAANEGYPRNHIPKPSPGVGGYCLTKDPYLYAVEEPELEHAQMARISRKVSQNAAEYPVRVLDKYIELTGKNTNDLRVLLIGLAFKGWPETNDLRGSTSLDTAKILKTRGYRVLGWDAIVKPEEIEREGIEPAEIYEACKEVDAIFILNNHPKNAPEGLISLCKGREVLIFDGWSMLDQKNVEQVDGLTYATMGYMTPLT